MKKRYTVLQFLKLSVLVSIFSYVGCDLLDVNPEDYIPRKKSAPAMENEDSFLDVFDKLMHKFPSFKSKFVMRFQKYANPNSPDRTSNPLVYFKTGIGNVPEPDDILGRFQAIIDASNMLKEESRSLIWKLRMYAEHMVISEKVLIQKSNGYISDLEELLEQHKMEADPLAKANIVVKFRYKEKEAIKCIEAINSIRKWESEINKRISQTSIHKSIMQHTI